MSLPAVDLAWPASLLDHQALAEACERIDRGGTLALASEAGAAGILLAAATYARSGATVLLVGAHSDEAVDAVDALVGLGLDAALFPALEIMPGDSSPVTVNMLERLELLRCLHAGSPPAIVAAPIQALMQEVPAPQQLEALHHGLAPGDTQEPTDLARWLASAGWERVDTIESPCEFAVRGDIVDVFPPGGMPTRIDFLGDRVEAIFEVDLATMGSDRRVQRLDLVAAAGDTGDKAATCSPVEHLPPGTVVILSDLAEIDEQARRYLDRLMDGVGVEPHAAVLARLRSRSAAIVQLGRDPAGSDASLVLHDLPTFPRQTAEALDVLAGFAAQASVVVLCVTEGDAVRLRELLDERPDAGSIIVRSGFLPSGVRLDEVGGASPVVVVPHHEIFHRWHLRRPFRQSAQGTLSSFLDLQVGDLVVHREHGIARFETLGMLGKGDAAQEYLTLRFAGSARLHVPAMQVTLVQKYVGASRARPVLSTLGGRAWAGRKDRVRRAVRDLARDLLRVQAARRETHGIAFPADTPWQRAFEASFPWVETPDQQSAIDAVKADMMRARPMDRLVCGDVGFGKTEIAVRAAFKAIEAGMQVAVLVPTTLLAEQHERVFRQRLANYPFRIESISRLVGVVDQRRVLEDLGEGRVDIVIGTHRLLSQDVAFDSLGLVVIDEEQRFGVRHKQALLAFRATVDVLTLSATPIPRTLHMAMVGLRDISSLATPPRDRLAVVTEVIQRDESHLRRSILRELAREGQVYFVHNRIQDIEVVAETLRRLVPEARVLVGHGRMTPSTLESVMARFLRREADVLVCTTIIESGIDIPSVNTIFIDEADRYGLADLHQLRGRVGRFRHRAYCYLLPPANRTVTASARRRLQAIEECSMLGSGFRIALRDLEIRGAGNLLGAQQSGHIAAVGYELYCHLLERAVQEQREGATEATPEAVIDLLPAGHFPAGWILSESRRLDAYRRLGSSHRLDTLASIEADLAAAYGPPPPPAIRLMRLAALRQAASRRGIHSISIRGPDVVIRTTRPAELKAALDGFQGTVRLVQGALGTGERVVHFRPPTRWLEPGTLVTVLLGRLGAPGMTVPGGKVQPASTP